jgi:glycosyltransferase involved in cell wall biosynthesis
MRVALVQSDEGSDERVLRVARVLKIAGHEATFLVPQTGLQPQRPKGAPLWQSQGFPWIPISAGHMPVGQKHYPRDPRLHAARALASVVLPFDVAWFFDAEWAMFSLRERRFLPHRLPVVVLDEVEKLPLIPTSLADVNGEYAQQYTRQWADKLFRNSLPGDETTKVAEVVALWQAQKAAVPQRPRKPATTPAVTVCMPYFEEPEFLPEALLSLERQTCQDFTVVVTDDGSPSDAARAAFAACEAKYAPRGWKFVRHRNSSAGGARNRAVQEASTEFLVFLDADDLAMPDMVEKFLHGILLTGDDCLVARNYATQGDPDGECVMLYDPVGNSLIGSMGDDMHGGSCMIFRREAFLSIGGFTEMRGVSFDDYELHIRANLAGLKWDILPEFVYRYRAPREQGVSRSTSAYQNLARVTRWYQQRMQPLGLGQLPLAFASAYWENERLGEIVGGMRGTLQGRRANAKWNPKARELKLLMLVANFPFGIVSGWHTRVQQMIKFFGSRYELTLMTAMPREELGPVRKETFEHLHAVLGVEQSRTEAATPPGTPFRVREHYTSVYRDALRTLPTDQYHAAMIDQVFLAEFLRDIDTLPVLTEHNIESKLLRQAAEREWATELPLHYQNAAREAELLEQYENRVWPEFALRAVVSEADREEMNHRVQDGRVVVASNGVDPDSWIEDVTFTADTVLFVGHLAYLPNVDGVTWFLDEIWPQVRKLRPGARLIVAGRDPSPVVKLAVARSEGVELVASPVSMGAVAVRASVAVAPLRLGSGTRIKILESMAWGLPVVSTVRGAEGIDALDEEHMLLRDDPQQFAEAVVRLLSDEATWTRMRTESAALVREHYSWERVFEPLDHALVKLITP